MSSGLLRAGALEFVLVPDAGVVRRVQRCLATAAAAAGWVVGTWPQLLGLARMQYGLLAEPEVGSTVAVFAQKLKELPDAFWARSLEVAEESTQAAVAQALTDLLTALEPLAPWPIGPFPMLPAHTRGRAEDLLRLARALDGQLPAHLEVILRLLQSPRREGRSGLRVHLLPLQSAALHRSGSRYGPVSSRRGDRRSGVSTL